MKDFTTTEAERKAKEKWQNKNKDKAKLYSYRSTAKNFINNYADEQDLKELEELINVKKKELNYE